MPFPFGAWPLPLARLPLPLAACPLVAALPPLPFGAWLFGQERAAVSGRRYQAQAETWEIANETR